MTHSVSAATLPVIRALLEEATRRNYRVGVLGVRARPQWAGVATFTHDDKLVRIVGCESALAVREAITSRDPSQWLVVLTDRPDEDLGAGIRAHLIGNRLRTPDPWDAVRQRFAATGIDTTLTSLNGHREVATGLLAAAPREGWPPAGAGVLTGDHVFAAVASAHLLFADQVVDLTSVLGWAADPGVTTRLADLRELAGNPLTDAVLEWLAERCGAVARPILHLLRTGEAGDAAPLGLVAGLLATARDGTGETRARLGREGLIRIEQRLGGIVPGSPALTSWAIESAAVIADMLASSGWQARGEELLARADALLGLAHAEGVASESALLPSGLDHRLAALAAALRQALSDTSARQTNSPDEPWVHSASLAAIEQAWGEVAAHQLAAQGEPRVAAFHAAVRLARWLAGSTAAGHAASPLADLVSRHVSDDAWADSAINDAAVGVTDPELGSGLAAVLAAASNRRAEHDAQFAGALAQHTAKEGAGRELSGTQAFWLLEDLLPDVLIPLAKDMPLLLLVLDGMSAGVATEILSSLLARTGDGWAEALLADQVHRAAALAVLPTLTEVSRASLLTGGLRTGGQDAEQRGYERLWRERGLTGAKLFHKKPLDSSLPGHAVAADVAAAIADVTSIPLVTCVLNTIDDALDRSDPAGTEWTASAVRHLVPLLERARHAGRVVVLTADHGHVIERRQGRQLPYPEMSSGRSRAASAGAAGAGEVLVVGERVLLHDGRAVLAVDENLRYGPLKAGYHGGASPAEAVVPVAVLVSGGLPDEESARMHLAPPQEPPWWTDPVSVPGVADQAPTLTAWPVKQRSVVAESRLGQAPGRTTRRNGRGSAGPAPTLFDPPVTEDEPAGVGSVNSLGFESPAAGLADAIVSSPVYAAQRKIAGRLSLQDGQVRDLLAALMAAPSGRLPATRAAAALRVAPMALRGAVLHVQRLLNVEGYAVLRIDADGSTVILDEALLQEQFGVGR